MKFNTNLYKKEGKKYIPGTLFRALVWYKDHYVHELLRIYADRTIAGKYLIFNLPQDRLYKHVSKYMSIKDKSQLKGFIGGPSWENVSAIPYKDFKYLVSKKLVTLNYSGAVAIELDNEPYTDLKDGYWSVNINEKMSDDDMFKTIEDIFRKLNNKKTTIRLCLNILCKFLQAKKKNKEKWRIKLREAYFNIPSFQRSKESPLYGLTIDLEEKLKPEDRTPIENIIFKKKNRFEDYKEFVKVYDDMYFEAKYKDKKTI